MRDHNLNALKSLNLFCHLVGLFSIFIGSVVIFMDALKQDFTHIQIGFYVFIVGYAFVKISKKLARVILEETIPRTN